MVNNNIKSKNVKLNGYNEPEQKNIHQNITKQTRTETLPSFMRVSMSLLKGHQKSVSNGAGVIACTSC